MSHIHRPLLLLFHQRIPYICINNTWTYVIDITSLLQPTEGEVEAHCVGVEIEVCGKLDSW